MFAGVTSSSRVTCPNTEMRRRDRRWTVKSDRSFVALHHFGLGRTIGFQAAVSDTSGGKHPESTHQLIVRSRCLRHIVTQTKQAWCRVSGACHSISVLETSRLHRQGRYGVLGLDDIDHLMLVNCQDKQSCRLKYLQITREMRTQFTDRVHAIVVLQKKAGLVLGSKLVYSGCEFSLQLDDGSITTRNRMFISSTDM